RGRGGPAVPRRRFGRGGRIAKRERSMKRIERLILLQFFTYEMESIELGGNIAFIGKNGSGKSALLDAIQIVVNGGHLNYLKLNSRSDVPTKRTLREYCLGVLQEDGSGHNLHARDQANTYITAVIRDDSGEPLTLGVCMHASTTEPTHDVQGLYVARGVELTLADHIEKVGADDAPLEWGDFHNLLKRRSAQVGQQVFTTTKPEAYIKEWLH